MAGRALSPGCQWRSERAERVGLQFEASTGERRFIPMEYLTQLPSSRDFMAMTDEELRALLDGAQPM